MVGDLPFANVRPPENVLFVCKLNPVTRDEDLELIFSRFGPIMSCQVIRDKKTGDSLQYAFIEFDKREDAEQVSGSFIVPALVDPFAFLKQAYFKMQNVLVDDRRIWVDLYVLQFFFQAYMLIRCLSASSQSVARLNNKWSNDPLREGQASHRNARGGGGFGGRDDLEATRKYRGGDGRRDRSPSYDMVLDLRGVKDSTRRHRGRDEREPRRHSRSRSRSPRERRDRRRRSRSRDVGWRRRTPDSDLGRDRFRDRRR